jgi:hypothetical protein
MWSHSWHRPSRWNGTVSSGSQYVPCSTHSFMQLYSVLWYQRPLLPQLAWEYSVANSRTTGLIVVWSYAVCIGQHYTYEDRHFTIVITQQLTMCFSGMNSSKSKCFMEESLKCSFYHNFHIDVFRSSELESRFSHNVGTFRVSLGLWVFRSRCIKWAHNGESNVSFPKLLDGFRLNLTLRIHTKS